LNSSTRHFSKDDTLLSSAPLPDEEVGDGGKLSGISRSVGFCLFSFLRCERLRYHHGKNGKLKI
jgi:hypothetical protein